VVLKVKASMAIFLKYPWSLLKKMEWMKFSDSSDEDVVPLAPPKKVTFACKRAQWSCFQVSLLF
jgi:hypothetical protein